MADNIASTFAAALDSILAQGETATVQELNMFSKRNEAEVSKWNSSQYGRIESCVHDIFKQQVLAHPDKPAIYAWNGEYTYSELDIISNRLSHHLVSLGVGPDTMVPLCFEKSAWNVVGMLAVLKAGGACVSLEPSHPRSRIETIIKDVKCKTILASTAIATQMNEMFEDVEALGIDQEFIDSLPPNYDPVQTQAQANNPAFVVYTSGSTGVPKGVVIEHGAVCTSSSAHGSVLDIGPNSRVLQFAAHVFDISIQDIFTTLSRGGCVCIPSDAERMDDLAGAINRMQVNWACITPTVAALLRPIDIPGLKTLVLAGEAVTRKVIETWKDAVNLNNCYGPAESTIYCAWNGEVGDSTSKSPSNIGTGLSSLLWIAEVSNHNLLSPVGCIGELLIEGPLLARGYLNDPVKTAASFIQNPAWATPIPSGKPRLMYKTGDLARYNSDGTLDYLGRKDSQVKIHGQRVELGEIEYHIKKLSSRAKEVVVDLASSTQLENENRLAAFISFDDSTSEMQDNPQDLLLPSSEDLQSEMLDLQSQMWKTIPLYMVPTMFVPLRKIPVNLSRKIDRRTLRQLVLDFSKEQILSYSLVNANKRAPETEMEILFQTFWSQVLRIPVDMIGCDDSFFRLGGDSVSAITLVALARDAGILISVADIFTYPTLSDMADAACRVEEEEEDLDVQPFAMMSDEDGKDSMLNRVTEMFDF